MNITINFHGDIYANIYGCHCAASDDFEDDFNEDYGEKIEEDTPDESVEDTAPEVIICAIDGLPECVPPELAAVIVNAAVTAFLEHITEPVEDASE